MTYAHDMAPGMGRKKEFAERIHLTLPEGTRERIDSVLLPHEDRLAMIRMAIGKELGKREKEAAKKKTGDGDQGN